MRTDLRFASTLAAVAALFAPLTQAATFNVGNAADLVAAINTANGAAGPDTIVFTGDIVLTAAASPGTGLPDITSEITLDGAGFTLSRFGGAPAMRFLHVLAGANLTINNLTLSGGGGTFSAAIQGGAIRVNAATLTVTNSRFTNNQVDAAGQTVHGGTIFAFGSTVAVSGSTFDANGIVASLVGQGGAINISNGPASSLTVTNTTFTGNFATATFLAEGGAVYVGSTGGTTSISGSTFNGNQVTGSNGQGSGMFSYLGATTIANSTFLGNTGPGAIAGITATLTVSNSTVAGNSTSAGEGGGIYSSGTTLTMNNTIVAANTSATTNPNCRIVGGTASGLTNGSDTGECPGSVPLVVGVDFNATLASNGGPTQTVALLPGSAAIDASGAACPATDQRGVARSTPCDLGAYELEITPPNVTSVDVPANGTYVAGQDLDFTVNWPENVVVNGTPQIALTIGAATRQATYVSGSGTAALLFRYSVAAPDNDADGIALGTLQLNGGTIRDIANNDAALTLPVVPTSGILVDALSPSVASVTPPPPASYTTGQGLDFTVNWSESVFVDTTGGTPQFALAIGAATRQATYLSGSGTSGLVFRYTVVAGDNDTDGIAVVGPLALNGGTIRDTATNGAVLTLNAVGATNAVLVDTTAAGILSVAVPAGANYTTGSILQFTTNWSEPVVVTGTPQISLTTGAVTRQATYASGSGTTGLVFQYTVVAGDNDNDGITVGALALNGGTIQDAAFVDATLVLGTVPSTANVFVNRTFTATPSAGANGGIAPNTPQVIAQGGGMTFTASPTIGYTTSWAGTTCPGTPSANTFQVTGIAADCTVAATFTSGAVTTFTGPTATGSGTATATLTGGGATCTLTTPQFIPLTGHARSPPAGTAPTGFTFPHGLFDFTTTLCTPGSTITVSVTYPTALPAGTQYWKYGPTPGNTTPHWYTLAATIAGNTATFNITDGQIGDDDLAPNGTIVDQGGPGVPGAPGTATAVPTLSEWMLMLLATLMLAMAWRRPGRAAK